MNRKMYLLISLIVMILAAWLIGSSVLNKNTKTFHIAITRLGFEMSAEFFSTADQSH